MEEVIVDNSTASFMSSTGFPDNGTNETLLELLTRNATKKSSLSLTNDSEYIFDRIWVRAIFITVYTIVFCLCVFGNLVVILVINLHWRMRSITNFCLGNLAFANLCVGVFCVYQNLSTYLITSWVFGDFMCKMYHFINSLSHTASILILVVICIERYLAIIHPIRCRQILTLNRLRVCIVAVWVISAIYCSPRLYYITTITVPRRDGAIEILCIPKRTLYDSHTFDIIHFFALFLLPLAVISIQYTIIGITLWRSSKSHVMSPPGAGGNRYTTFSSTSLDRHSVGFNSNGRVLQNGATNVSSGHPTPRHASPNIETDLESLSPPTSPSERKADSQERSRHSCFNCLVGRTSRRLGGERKTVIAIGNSNELNCAREEMLQDPQSPSSTVANISAAVETQLAILFSSTTGVGRSGGRDSDTDSMDGLQRKQRRVPERKQRRRKQQLQRQKRVQKSKLFRFREKMKAFRMDDCCEGGGGGGDANAGSSTDQESQPRTQQGGGSPNRTTSYSRATAAGVQQGGGGGPGELKLRRRGGIKNARFGAQALQSRRRVVRMLIVIVVTFALCNFPFHARKLWQIWSSSYKGGSMFSTLFTPITFIIMYANCAINPILYAFMSTTFRRSLVELFCCRMKRQHNNNHNLLKRQESVLASAHLT